MHSSNALNQFGPHPPQPASPPGPATLARWSSYPLHLLASGTESGGLKSFPTHESVQYEHVRTAAGAARSVLPGFTLTKTSFLAPPWLKVNRLVEVDFQVLSNTTVTRLRVVEITTALLAPASDALDAQLRLPVRQRRLTSHATSLDWFWPNCRAARLVDRNGA